MSARSVASPRPGRGRASLRGDEQEPAVPAVASKRRRRTGDGEYVVRSVNDRAWGARARRDMKVLPMLMCRYRRHRTRLAGLQLPPRYFVRPLLVLGPSPAERSTAPDEHGHGHEQQKAKREQEGGFSPYVCAMTRRVLCLSRTFRRASYSPLGSSECPRPHSRAGRCVSRYTAGRGRGRDARGRTCSGRPLVISVA